MILVWRRKFRLVALGVSCIILGSTWFARSEPITWLGAALVILWNEISNFIARRIDHRRLAAVRQAAVERVFR